MKFPAIPRSLLAVSLLGALSAHAAVVVTFQSPERFIDAGDADRRPQQTILEIEQYLQYLGERYLPLRSTLRIEVLDIDLAGSIRYAGRYVSGMRVLTGGADWPTIKLRYVLESDGGIVGRGEETVSDMNYLASRTGAPPTSEPLAYEKRMLEDWFKARFQDGNAAAR